MNIIKTSFFKIITILQFALIVTWTSHLVYTDSYFSVYAFCCAISMLCLYDNTINKRGLNAKNTALNLTISSLVSFAVTLANYPIFQRLRNVHVISAETNSFLNGFEAVLTFVGGIVVFYQIFLCIASRFPITYSSDNPTLRK